MEAAGSTSLDRPLTGAARDWRVLGAFAALVLGVIALTWPTWVGLVAEWQESSHGFLIAAIAAWLAWRALGQQPVATSKPAWWMLIAVAGVSFVWFFLRAATVGVLEQTAATVLIWDALIPVPQAPTSAAAGAASLRRCQ